MGLKVGSITGTPILGQPATEDSRRQNINRLNAGELDGLVVTDKLGATGYNLASANHVIFLGSLYSITMERQAIGNMLQWHQLTLGRVARRGQRRTRKAYIIASRNFPGDSVALSTKEARGEEDDAMIQRMTEAELAMLTEMFAGVGLRPDGKELIDLTNT